MEETADNRTGKGGERRLRLMEETAESRLRRPAVAARKEAGRVMTKEAGAEGDEAAPRKARARTGTARMRTAKAERCRFEMAAWMERRRRKLMAEIGRRGAEAAGVGGAQRRGAEAAGEERRKIEETGTECRPAGEAGRLRGSLKKVEAQDGPEKAGDG